MAYANPRIRRLLLLLVLLGLLLVILSTSHVRRRRPHVPTKREIQLRTAKLHAAQVLTPEQPAPEKAIIIPKMTTEEVEWSLEVPGWQPYIYSTSHPSERGYLTVPALRGRETVPYLTFIIDYYDNLPAYTAFIHADRKQHHNDVLGPWTSTILENLRLETVDRQGYVNLRCSPQPGCPIGINPLEPTQTDIERNDTRAFFADIYMEIFDVGPSKVPAHIGNVCCAQFAVSRERILERPKKDYERIRTWAIESNVTDSFGVGWVMEKLWHITFGMPAQHCPSFEQCRCDLFGWCGVCQP